MASLPNLPAPPSGFGRTFLIGGTIVAAGLTGFYMNMLRNKRIQEEEGNNPHFEQVIAHASKKPAPGETLPVLHHLDSDIPPAFPGKNHHSGHSTIKDYKQSPGYAESGEAIRFMAPPAQRVGTDGTGRVYTKAPSYVDNYGKTRRLHVPKDPDVTA